MLEFENRCESAGRWIEACERQVGKASAGDANILLEKRWCPLAFRCRQSLMLAELAMGDERAAARLHLRSGHLAAVVVISFPVTASMVGGWLGTNRWKSPTRSMLADTKYPTPAPEYVTELKGTVLGRVW